MTTRSQHSWSPCSGRPRVAAVLGWPGCRSSVHVLSGHHRHGGGGGRRRWWREGGDGGRGGEGRGRWAGWRTHAPSPPARPEAGLPSRQVETISHLAPGDLAPPPCLLLSLNPSPAAPVQLFRAGRGELRVFLLRGALTQRRPSGLGHGFG